MEELWRRLAIPNTGIEFVRVEVCLEDGVRALAYTALDDGCIPALCLCDRECIEEAGHLGSGHCAPSVALEVEYSP